jgi:hypothetical protein
VLRPPEFLFEAGGGIRLAVNGGPGLDDEERFRETAVSIRSTNGDRVRQSAATARRRRLAQQAPPAVALWAERAVVATAVRLPRWTNMCYPEFQITRVRPLRKPARAPQALLLRADRLQQPCKQPAVPGSRSRGKKQASLLEAGIGRRALLRFFPLRQRGGRRRRWLLSRASDSPVRLQVTADLAATKQVGGSRKRGKAGLPSDPARAPDGRRRRSARDWRGAGPGRGPDPDPL